jgi:hypothetical protein
MSTGSLLRWIALVAGAELAVRGYGAGAIARSHAGAALFAIALAALLWRTRAQRAGLAIGAVMFVVAAADAALALRHRPEPLPDELPRPVGPFDCERTVVVVEARSPSALADDLADALVLVSAPATWREDVLAETPALGRQGKRKRASPLANAVEQVLRARLDTDAELDPRTSPIIARYRETLLAARRAGADVALLILLGEETSPAARELAHGVRALAGSYGMRAIDSTAALDDILAERNCK